MSDFETLYRLIKEGEHARLDFKLHITSPEKIAKTIAAFANSEGGKIIVGVSDEGDIAGVDVAQEKFMLLRAAGKFCRPKVFLHFSVLNAKKKQVLVAEVKKQTQGLVEAVDEKGNAFPYLRVADETIIAPGFEDTEAIGPAAQKPIPIIHLNSKSLVQYLEEHSVITMKEYMRLMNIGYNTARRSLEHLVETGVIEKSRFQNIDYYRMAEKPGQV